MFILTRVKRDMYECVYTTLLCHHVLSVPKHIHTHTHTQNTAIDPPYVRTLRLQVDGSFPCVYGKADLFRVGLVIAE